MDSIRTGTRKSLPLFMALLLLGAAHAGGQAGSGAGKRAGVAGRVTVEKSPLPAAGVYAYQLADLTLHKVVTDTSGNFRFDDLPAGLYKIIVHKAGFMPAVVLITRTTAAAYQFLELQLAQQTLPAMDAIDALDPAAGEDFWSVRSRIPPDVLRDILGIQAPAGTETQVAAFASAMPAHPLASFHTEMQAMTGVDQIAGEPGQVQGGRVGFEGRLGRMQVGLSGRFWNLDSGASGEVGTLAAADGADGETRAVSLNLENGDDSRIQVTSLNNRLVTREDGVESPVDLEHYRVSWSQALGDNGRSDFSAQYTAESNYHRRGGIDPENIPEASRDWLIEGSYTTAFSDRSTLQTGVRYRERQSGLSVGPDPLFDSPGRATVDVFGRGGTRLQPAVLVEYGLYTTMRDGSVSLTPRGGLVLQLGPQWQAETSVSRRAYQDDVGNTAPEFLPTLYQASDFCEQGGESCYELSLSRRTGDDAMFSLGAVHRTIGDTFRLYFSDDFFDRRQSLYLVRGDELPEFQVKMSHKLAPQVLAKLESSIASGGGGLFHATDHQPYENRVSYVVTSLDTQFQSSMTGVFLAFYRLSQQLEPIGAAQAAGPEIEVERLRLMLSQNLNLLLDVGADWAVQLNLELSRGDDPAAQAGQADELKKRFVGGLAVKF